MKPSIATTILCVLSTTAIGQGAPQSWSKGPVVNQPHGLSVDPATVLTCCDADDAIVTNGGFTTSEPTDVEPAAPEMPDLSQLPWLIADPPIDLDIDAMSLGLDWVLSESDGRIPMNIAGPGWGAVTFSVTRATAGTSGSLIESEVAGPGGAAGDIIAYIFPGSSNVPIEWVDVPLRSHDATETGLGFTANIDAHDFFMGQILRLMPDEIETIAPDGLELYFSVTEATKMAVPGAWLSGALPNTSPPVAVGIGAPSAAAVFVTRWDSDCLEWTEPRLAYPPGYLGLTEADDLDALALDLKHYHPAVKVLFSATTSSPSWVDPVMYVEPAMMATAHVYKLPNGSPTVAERVGLRPPTLQVDDVDAICAHDPGLTATVQELWPSQAFPGEPQSRDIGIQVYGAKTGFPIALTTYGYPTVPMPALPILFADFAGPGALSAVPTAYSAWFLPPVTGFQGRPMNHIFVASIPPGFVGHKLVFTWVFADVTLFSSFDVAWPVAVEIRS